MPNVLREDYLVGWQQTHQFLRVGDSARHLDVSHPTGGPVPCTTECEDCPWVDFRDYDQCGLTFNRQCPKLVTAR